MQQLLEGKQRKYLVLIFLFITPSANVLGQDAIFSQFFSSSLYLNPAFAGSSGCQRFVTNYRNQPFPDFGTFSTFNVSYDQTVPSLSGGLGLLVTSDHQGGLVMKNQISAVYAYHLQANRNLFINFGVQAGYYRKDLNWERLEFSNQWNPSTGEILPQTENPPDQVFRHSANFAAGILIYNDKFYGGLAAHNLTRPTEGFFEDYSLDIKYTAHFGVTLYPLAGGTYRENKDEFSISPNLIVQSQGDTQRLNYGFYAAINPLVVGAWLRQNLKRADSLIFLLGLNQDNYRIGYSYDYSLSGFSTGIQGGHEISVTLNLNCTSKNMKYRILNCPSF